jgi:periplasmic protein TonB
MTIRCFLFSSDEGTAAILRPILSDLGVEGEFCPNAVTAVERITTQPFQIVIIDWDQQPEAGLLLSTARERKASERALTLAIVSDDADAPKALHAGANSLLRKPIVASQAKETLTTARDLLRAKQSSVPSAAQASVAGAMTSPLDQSSSATLRAGDFLQTPTLNPGAQFETEAQITQSQEASSASEIDPLKDLEPTAASVSQESDQPAEPEKPTGSRGLQWYLKTRSAAQVSGNSAAATAPAPITPSVAPPITAPARGNPELLGYDQPAYSPPPKPIPPKLEPPPIIPVPKWDPPTPRDQKKEADLHAYIDVGADHFSEPKSGFRLGKRPIIIALVLAACAVFAAPQAPWHPRIQGAWRSGKQTLHAWLNPQPITPPPAPAVHETFTRPGDEYKLPVAETIPDATTDPSQIEVVPVIDPTIKKTNNQGANAMDSTAVPVDGSTGSTTSAQPVPDVQPAPANADPFRPVTEHTTPAPQPTVTVVPPPVASHTDPFTVTPPTASSVVPVPAKPVQPRPASTPGKIPSSLNSQLASTAPTFGGNKPLEAALPSIEPVNVPEATERLLIAEDPQPTYPANAKGQQGAVILEVLIARDGTVQDAKFLQGSLVFARNAIDAVRQWKFRPYTLNGRPVSVQTQVTLKFKPGQ